MGNAPSTDGQVERTVSTPQEYELDTIKDSDEKYAVLVTCADCGEELNRTVAMTGRQVNERWLKLVMGAGFAAGKCKNKCRSTFSDMNMNTKMKIVAAC